MKALLTRTDFRNRTSDSSSHLKLWDGLALGIATTSAAMTESVMTTSAGDDIVLLLCATQLMCEKVNLLIVIVSSLKTFCP